MISLVPTTKLELLVLHVHKPADQLGLLVWAIAPSKWFLDGY